MRPNIRSTSLFVALALVAGACGLTDDDSTTAVDPTPTATPTPTPLDGADGGAATDGGDEPTPTAEVPATIDPAIDARLGDFGEWMVPVTFSEDDRELVDDTWTEAKVTTTCRVSAPESFSTVFDDLAAFPFSGEPLAPGLIVEASGLEDASLIPLSLGRAPITLVSSLASANPVVVVEEPDSATLATAVAGLKRDADAQITGIDVVPADVTYVSEETRSFEQTALGLGVSLRYDSPLAEAGFESTFEQERQVEKHSILVRMTQPMYTIRVSDDDVDSPGDYLNPATSLDEVERLVSAGRLGADNQPLLIDSVTYGRIMYFTLTSTSVSSASELSVALDAAYKNYEGSGEITEEQRQTLSESRVSYLAYGGDQDLALSAISSGDLGRFFGPANTTTAAPLSFTLRTLTGERVEIADEATASAVLCDRTSEPYRFEVAVTGVIGNADVELNGTRIREVDSTGVFEIVPGSWSSDITGRLVAGTNTLTVDFTNAVCTNAQITVTISVDGDAKDSRGFDACGFFFTWEWNLNRETGQVTRL